MLKYSILILSLFSTLGCTATHTKNTLEQWQQSMGSHASASQNRQHSWVLPRGASIALLPTQATFTSSVVSYNRLSRTIDETLQKHLEARFAAVHVLQDDVRVAYNINSFSPDIILKITLHAVSDELSSAQELRSEYGTRSAYAKERAKTRSGIGRDRLKLHISMMDARTQKLLDTFAIQSQSGWYQFYAHTPHDLVDQWVAQFVSSISDA